MFFGSFNYLELGTSGLISIDQMAGIFRIVTDLIDRWESSFFLLLTLLVQVDKAFLKPLVLIQLIILSYHTKIGLKICLEFEMNKN
jgi:hypothetical protein